MTDEGLLRAATALQASNPTAWKELLAALKRRSIELAAQTVRSHPDMVQVAQGRARECGDLLEVLESARERLDTRAARKPL